MPKTNPKSNATASVPYEDDLYARLRDDDELALAYLIEALQDDDPQVFVLALKDVIDAQNINISRLAEDAGLHRVTVHRMLSEDSSPAWKSVVKLVKNMGYQFTIDRAAS
jgi:probable addiction module antidote protein